MSTRKQRSREGCWTCKDKRRKCDGARPVCHNCQQRDIECGGYEVRLRWGTGIASRGKFTGAEEPVAASIPDRPQGRRRDREKNRGHEVMVGQSSVPSQAGTVSEDHDIYGSEDSDTQPNWNRDNGGVTTARSDRLPDDRQLFEQFLTSGINTLHSTAVNDASHMLPVRLPTLCTQSEALYAVCIAFQASLSEEYKSRFFEYFDAALSAFRLELAGCQSYLQDATWTAGMLLCSIGVTHGLSWSMHLQGIYTILRAHGFDDDSGQQNPFRAHLLEVMGIIDLPTFSVGRQTPCIGIWRRYCRGTIFHRYPDRDKVEHVSGLPRSLLDIFSGIGAGSEEVDFWHWPGARGTFLQSHLWEAYRLAGMLTVRHRQIPIAVSPAASYDRSATSKGDAPDRNQAIALPTTDVLVGRILSNIDAIIRASKAHDPKDDLVVNAISYPAFVAGLEIGTLKENEDWRSVIIDSFATDYLEANQGVQHKLLLEILEEIWRRDDEALNVDEFVRGQGRELGLL